MAHNCHGRHIWCGLRGERHRLWKAGVAEHAASCDSSREVVGSQTDADSPKDRWTELCQVDCAEYRDLCSVRRRTEEGEYQGVVEQSGIDAHSRDGDAVFDGQ